MTSLQRRWHYIWRYLRGDAPWDSGIVPPEIVAWLDHYAGAPGRALDLGCGTGTTTRHLAARGWTAVGVDFAPNAITRARWRARREARRGAHPGSLTFISADVSRPDLLDDADPFDLVVDVGCLHGLSATARSGYAANVTRLTRPDTTMLLYAFKPFVNDTGRAVGIDRAELADLLDPAFALIDVVEGEEATTPRPSAWYTLRRTEVRS